MIRSDGGPISFGDAGRLADAIVERVGKTIVLALPLGIGKANHIANALYAKAVADRSLRLTIFTGLTLEPPRAKMTYPTPPTAVSATTTMMATRARRIPSMPRRAPAVELGVAGGGADATAAAGIGSARDERRAGGDGEVTAASS